MSDDSDNKPVIEFPLDLPLKIMGLDTPRLHAVVLEIVERHFGPVDPTGLNSRHSRTGKYISYTLTVRAESRAQLDAAYGELSASEDVRWVI